MKKTPKELKIATGTYRKDRDKTTDSNVISQFSDIPEAPAHLSVQAQEIYYATAKSLNMAGNLNAETVQIVADYSYYLSQSNHWQQRATEIEKKLFEAGTLEADRAFTNCSRLARQNSSQALKLATKLKLLPGDRQPSQEQKRSKLDEFIN